MSAQSRQPHRAGLTVVATVSGMLTAKVFKSKLEAAGIAAMLDYESAGLLFGITAGGLKLGQVRILVADQDTAEAQVILNTPPLPDSDAEEATPPHDTR
jgi:hypothetical protein